MVPAGEDRWLCTLLLKQGWRVEYNAASDAYTNAPEEFKEFYNQVIKKNPTKFSENSELCFESYQEHVVDMKTR